MPRRQSIASQDATERGPHESALSFIDPVLFGSHEIERNRVLFELPFVSPSELVFLTLPFFQTSNPAWEPSAGTLHLQP